MAYNSFEEMPVWQKAMELAVRIFKLTENLPRKENVILIKDIWKELNSLINSLYRTTQPQPQHGNAWRKT